MGKRDYPTLRKLHAGETIDVDGLKLKMDDGEIKEGDLYVAERNTGPHFLTAQKVVMSECGCCVSYICPTTNHYSFDGGECVKVREA